ncbi:MAG: nucleoside phosphorylase [Bacilli bacterium]|nr:nucleoside phosphorylase [Bacilli bacterium]
MLFEFDESKEAVINPNNVIDKINNIPEVAIACYSKSLFDKIVEGAKCTVIGEISNTNGKRKIYEVEYNKKKLTLFLIGVGAPVAACDLEDLHEMGVNKFIVFGNCGVLDKNIDDCSIIIPTEAIRDEGTSYHYIEPNKTIKVNKKYVTEFKEVLDKFGYSYTEGMTWTTDAFYRETRKKLESRVSMGAKCVEMESSALQAVADFRGFDFFTFFYAGDNLDLPEWDQRSLSGDVKLDEKSRIALLALELGYKISK